MHEFKLGDTAIVCNQVGEQEYLNGLRVEIVGALAVHNVEWCGLLYGYLIDSPALEGERFAPTNMLRKPPREIDTVVSWADCAWQPNLNPSIQFETLVAMRREFPRLV